jgi:hypothetical protein
VAAGLGARVIDALLTGLERLDERLACALDAAGAEPLARFRGLYLTAGDVRREMAAPPGAPRLWSVAARGGEGERGSGRLALAFGLDGFDLDVLLLALAPEVDARYGRCYAYLQDDVTRRRPTVALALDLLCSTAAERLARRRRFEAGAPLRANGVLQAAEDADAPGSLLATALVAEPAVARRLLGAATPDPRLASRVRPAPREADTAAALLDPAARAALKRLAGWPPPVAARLAGPPGSARAAAAAVLAHRLGRPLLHVDVADAPHPDVLAAVALREARLTGAVLLLAGAEAPRRLAPDDVVLTDGAAPVTIDLAPAGPEQRRAAWDQALRAADAARPAQDVAALASRFRIGPDAIAAAAADASAAARLRGGRARVSREDLFAAARRRSATGLSALATRVEPRRRWSELVLPAETLGQLREVCDRVAVRDRVLGDWGFDRRLSLGKGVAVLFGGASGTGKTLAAQMLAGELGLDLYRVDLAGVVSKYIGETEKNLERIFAAASDAGAIVFFDEAEALFGKRSEVSDAHDRYANIEIAYLLQRMEAHEGVAILATNLRQQLDEAFLRRLAATIHFPFPDEPARRRIWAGIWPPEAQREPDVDAALLASRFRMTGGAIRNAALTAAYRAAAADRAIALADVLHGVRREFQKLGKTLTAAELLGGDAALEVAA